MKNLRSSDCFGLAADQGNANADLVYRRWLQNGADAAINDRIAAHEHRLSVDPDDAHQASVRSSRDTFLSGEARAFEQRIQFYMSKTVDMNKALVLAHRSPERS
jgi:hypothetical protein